MDTISLSCTVFEIFDFKVFRVWLWPLTPKGHLRSKKFILFESPYMTSYLTSMDTMSLSCTVFEIFESKFLGFDLDLWPLKVICGQNFLYHLKAHRWLPIWLLWTTSLYCVPFSKYSTSKFVGFDLDLWPLKIIWGQQIFLLFESQYMTSYLTSMDTISLSRTVSEIFDFKVFRVWPWPLTPKGHLGSKKIIPFGSSYITSYLTSMDTISLSRSVFEIFNFKVFRVWPWPLTSKGHLRSKKFIPFESPYMTLNLTTMNTISLSRTVLEIMLVKILKAEQNGGFWPFRGQGQESIFSFIEKAPPLTKRCRLRYCASKSVQPFRLYPCQRA